MFTKILIANRGEIACRVIRTARRMGIRTVAVYSEADVNARHVRLADEAVCIGPAAVNESYLVIERILDAAKRTGAQAVHPGYGFLSENDRFADACAESGIVFIGPPAEAIRAMGSKSAAKKIMGAAKVPLTPGYHGDVQDANFLLAQADVIGYPVLIKAAAGGGGKGMRMVERSEDFPGALASCRREALSFFGSEHVLIEKYLTRSRHIEIQVFADTHGNCVYLFERDCSVQRRHQKVLEEAPAPGMTTAHRAAMGKAAVDAARAVGYVGAGTVEFIAGETFAQDGAFYFMEMNTRLQVEHPVTEMITGQDLVEWQLRVANGEPLPLRQDQLEIRGHALEARIYAEDATRGFLPSTGRLIHLAPPAVSLNVRVDTGIEQGDEITSFYDPMIAKLIVWDVDRNAALARMQQALADYRIVGVTANIDFLSRLVACPAFANADLDTGLIERSRDFLFPASVEPPRVVFYVAAVAELLREQSTALATARQSGDPWSPWSSHDGWRLNIQSRRTVTYRSGETLHEVVVAYEADGWRLTLAGESVLARGRMLDSGQFAGQLAVELDDRRLIASVIAVTEKQIQKRHVFLNGATWVVLRDDPLHLVEAGGTQGGGLTAPMPGKVVALLAAPGQTVEKGKPLLILEAMKMEHTVIAPKHGTVKAFCYAVGDQVVEGAELVEFEAETKQPVTVD
ncbi:acetyl/propionyl/methylcrotonyl-CoA carboxylase subunit alpha [Propionivibrio sp.]|uniref:acetyl/propionyl/methylcrotonyl-CoA carboxylase subunit alpha n=1 Tax=Propionivibrio sp. TaxID=2212460 RepID=UPI0025E86C96|nr:acetyl/propionyl/methylcrotonyl-CoA carboxylase subunit alpha [Propionivibrio sp.]MBK7357188.1 acetyl/propionyl/methylcrotonyl-CoA carboxylase subunit alpha [Propionivibrio sp.]MBK8401419.1 acetyl/propionyl/methylcrotonyl-CoA carboxylase subunit alpha [Propionivibrio sp.]MBK8746151.1 acetyl/propionyl/methylcrotonyl-CoA carboxylase subunit alpha [Propionivibrio sp.]